MACESVEDLFAGRIRRSIEEVIKVDQADEQIVREEIGEYVVTDSLRGHFGEVLDLYLETPNKPHERVGVWVSGFFGSGKSSFAKFLGVALEDRPLLGEGAGGLLARRAGDRKVEVLLRNIAERVPTEAVIFDVSTDRGIRSGNQTITEITYRVFLQALGYAKDLDLSELEIALEEDGRLGQFEETFSRLFDKEWNAEKGKVAFALGQASRVMHEIEPETWSAPDSWARGARDRADITPGLLAERCKELMARRQPGRSLVFVIDEVGQFVARDVGKMLDLQAVVQSLGRVGRGSMWLVVTSQERLGDVVSGLDDRRVELARLRDRFPTEVHLEPSDISEVTSRRVLSKNAEAERLLRGLFEHHRGRLSDLTRISADIRLPELTAERFIDLYPLLPYQIDLVIKVVSGLRTQAGASRHVGGANRTIIKLAQQLLVNPAVDLASQEVGVLARIDHIYDLVEGNIAGEVRGKIAAIPGETEHPLAQPVAKAICLLQYVQSIHRTAENIAAALHPSVDAAGRLPEVRAALDELVAARLVRRGDDGYRIPSPVEDDWERERVGIDARSGDVRRILAEVLDGLWKPQPRHDFLGTKVFKAGLVVDGRPQVSGDVPVYLTFAAPGQDFDERVEELRARSRDDRSGVFWVAAVPDAVERAAEEVHRSKEMLARRERSARSHEEGRLVGEEKATRGRHQDRLRRLLREAVLSGTVWFSGNDRSPDEAATEVGRAAGAILGKALPDVFDRYGEAAARVGSKDLDALLSCENLRGLPPVFTDLGLVRDEAGQAVIHVECKPLAEVMARIENRVRYGEPATGRYLADLFGKEPFGWDFDAVRLLVVSLLRAGRLEATGRSQTIESALSVEARNTFPNNNLFRKASFRPKVGLEFADLARAAEAYKSAFGRDVAEIEQGVLARAVREAVAEAEDGLRDAHRLLADRSLPGVTVLDEAETQAQAIRAGKEDAAILAFNGSHRQLGEAIRRAAELAKALTEPRLLDLERAARARDELWPFLDGEDDLDEACGAHAEELGDLLDRETFFRELPAIDEHARALEQEYQRRYDEAVTARADAYEVALEELRSTPGWEELAEDQQERVEGPLAGRAVRSAFEPVAIPVLRADLDACPGRLAKAVEEALRIIDGKRLVCVQAAKHFRGGVETEEELEDALGELRAECGRLLAAGKKVLVQ